MRRSPLVPQMRKGPAGVTPHVEAVAVGNLRQGKAILRLGKGLTAGEGQAIGQRVLQQLRRHLIHRHLHPAIRVMAVRVVAAGAAVGAALDKAGKPETRAVYYRILLKAINSHKGIPFSARRGASDAVLDAVSLLGCLGVVPIADRA